MTKLATTTITLDFSAYILPLEHIVEQIKAAIADELDNKLRAKMDSTKEQIDSNVEWYNTILDDLYNGDAAKIEAYLAEDLLPLFLGSEVYDSLQLKDSINRDTYVKIVCRHGTQICNFKLADYWIG